MSARTHDVLAEVLLERAAQDAQWGVQDHPDGTSASLAYVADAARRRCAKRASLGTLTFADILSEEHWEALAEVNPAELRAELIQVAAVAVAWVEAIDLR